MAYVRPSYALTQGLDSSGGLPTGNFNYSGDPLTSLLPELAVRLGPQLATPGGPLNSAASLFGDSAYSKLFNQPIDKAEALHNAFLGNLPGFGTVDLGDASKLAGILGGFGKNWKKKLGDLSEDEALNAIYPEGIQGVQDALTASKQPLPYSGQGSIANSIPNPMQEGPNPIFAETEYGRTRNPLDIAKISARLNVPMPAARTFNEMPAELAAQFNPDIQPSVLNQTDTISRQALERALINQVPSELNQYADFHPGVQTFGNPANREGALFRSSQPMAKRVEDLMATPATDFIDRAVDLADQHAIEQQDILGTGYKFLDKGYEGVKVPGGNVLMALDDIESQIQHTGKDAYGQLQPTIQRLREDIKTLGNTSGVPIDWLKQNRTLILERSRGLKGQPGEAARERGFYTNDLNPAFLADTEEAAQQALTTGKMKGKDIDLYKQTTDLHEQYRKFKELQGSGAAKFLAGRGAEKLGFKPGGKVVYDTREIVKNLSDPVEFENFSKLTKLSKAELADQLEGSLLLDPSVKKNYGTRNRTNVDTAGKMEYDTNKDTSLDYYDVDAMHKELTGKMTAKGWKTILDAEKPGRYAETVKTLQNLNKVKDYGSLLEDAYKGHDSLTGTVKYDFSGPINQIHTNPEKYKDMPKDIQKAFGDLDQLTQLLNKSDYASPIIKQAIESTVNNSTLLERFGNLMPTTLLEGVGGIRSSFERAGGDLSNINPSGIKLNASVQDILKNPTLTKKLYGKQK